MISIEVVTKGPVETAGSILNFSRKMGSTDATKQAILIEVKIELPTIIPSKMGEWYATN